MLDTFSFLLKRGRLIAGMTVVVAFGCGIILLVVPKIYTATAVLMPPQSEQTTDFVSPGVVASSGIAATLGLKNPNELYVGILKSRTIADGLITRFKLKERYSEDTLIDTRRTLARRTVITADKSGLISIEFDDEDPKFAAEVANAYVEEFDAVTMTLAISDAARRRLFFEHQLDVAKKELAAAEMGLKESQERTGLIQLTDQGRAIIDVVVQLRAQVAAKEVQIQALKLFATSSHPELQRATEELRQLRTQLVRLESDKEHADGGILVPTAKVPEAGLEYVRRFREVRFREGVVNLLFKQYEMARVDEGKNATVVQVVDKAVEPDKKSKPKRLLILSVVTFFGFLLSLAVAYLLEQWARELNDPQNREAADRLKQRVPRGLWRLMIQRSD